MDKNLLELWGQTLLEMAKIAKGPQAFFDFFQNGFAKKEPEPQSPYDQFVNLGHRMFGKEGIERFNTIMKEFYENVGVVPRCQYNELHKKYLELLKRIQELEAETERLKKKFEGRKGPADDLMEQWTHTMRQYAEINQQFFREFSKFFKE